MVKVKTGVKPRNLLIAAGLANTSEKLGLTLVITSGTDGVHMSGSKHYNGDALDVRISNLTPAELRSTLSDLTSRLSPLGFQVILEDDHIHIEYDPS